MVNGNRISLRSMSSKYAEEKKLAMVLTKKKWEENFHLTLRTHINCKETTHVVNEYRHTMTGKCYTS